MCLKKNGLRAQTLLTIIIGSLINISRWDLVYDILRWKEKMHIDKE